MPQDPNSNYGSDPQHPYGTNPENPYQPYGPTPTDPYSAGPSGAPTPQASYPPNAPYPSMPYPGSYQPGYGYPPPNQGFGYNPPPSPKIPLADALRQLPRQYLRVLTKPSAATFAEEMGKADWNVVWIELAAYAVISVIFSYLFYQEIFHILLSIPQLSVIFNNSNLTTGSNNSYLLTPAYAQASALSNSLTQMIYVPIGIFLSTGIYYLIAKAFKGRGEFLTQLYTTLLFLIPLNTVTLLLFLIPFVGWVLAFALGIYSIFLYIYMLMAVHRLSGGKATLVYFIPVIAAFILIAIFAALFGFLIYSIIHSMPQSYQLLWYRFS